MKRSLPVAGLKWWRTTLVKRNILRMLVDRGCELTVVPAQTPASEVLAMKPDGVFLSNGPAIPNPVTTQSPQ